ncbi:AraC family transcriptional regulator [Microbacterium sp. W4I4]|uniref:helix-turn-helix domain-containing protein n=1 Tax=Microbacterium sp. W4I4 TaxID=3042295 RepID=UPI0027D85F63|nr:AraC family transcriptional regulator [Microbacterium sp. W4I4]
MTILDLTADAAEFDVRPSPEHADLVTFTFIEHGAVLSKHADEPWLSFGVSMVVSPEGIERRVRFDSPTRLLSVRVPSSELAGFVSDLPLRPIAHDDQRMLDRALNAFLNAVMSSDRPSSAIDKYAIEHLVLEMCGAILLDRMGSVWTHGAPGTALRDRALAVIAQQCEDAELTPARVARAVQSSLRQLQAVFAEVGLTIATEIRRHRARLARATLINSRFDVLTIAQVAHRSGFGNPMSLRRALHDVYGIGPKELRRTRDQSA